ncbi:11671_t:CDS:2 [Ambispora gerdemannii]|uniref:11671_t:CDS:1 n=1 Tax=Ambispora gerdemannii TaxID=144530 RepID=A0A9N9BFG8_9GLOM|nr:11671_t:CDS:2 [Ambispora gerdemannii]
MANFYSLWYKQSVCQRNINKGKSRYSDDDDNSNSQQPRDIAVSTLSTELLTAAHVTVSHTQDKLVYNLELKPWDTLPAATSLYSPLRSRETRFHNSNRSRQHTRTISNESTSSNISQLSEESLWDDWIVKYISNGDGTREIIGGDSFEEWIFDTKNLSQRIH